MKDETEYLPFCDGSTLKNREIKITLSPDIAFRLERLAEREGKTLEEHISSLIIKESEKAFPNHKDFYKKLFK